MEWSRGNSKMKSLKKVIDASVVVKWYNKEQYSLQADFLKKGISQGG
ncbi:MAG: hypothetical protein ACE5R6_03425 [Candidatus Heimdallarchaeota archaeon]